MTGMGEDVYIDHKANREAVLDELVAESQRLGLYGDAPDNAVEDMVEAAAKPIYDELYTSDLKGGFCPHEWEYCKQHARAALESLGVPLEVLAAVKVGTMAVVPVSPPPAYSQDGNRRWEWANMIGWGRLRSGPAPKTPEAAR